MKRLLKGLGKVALIAGAIVLLGGMALYVYSRERHDLPPFDHAKAAVLPAKTRAQYERDLFNEIRDWNAGTPGHDLWSREAEWLRMARDGYELAYITLQVLSPTKGIFAVEKPGHMDGTATRSIQFFDQTGAAAIKVFLNFGGKISTEREAWFKEVRKKFQR